MTEEKKKRRGKVFGKVLFGSVVGLGAAVAAALTTKKGQRAGKRLKEAADVASQKLKEAVAKGTEAVREQTAALGAGLQAGRAAVQRRSGPRNRKRVTRGPGKRSRASE